MSSDSTQPMSLASLQLPSQPSQSQSQDGMSLLNKAYGEVQSLEASIQSYEHSKAYFQPLGKISKQQLHEAEKVLNDIKNILEEDAKHKEADANFTRPDEVNKKLRMLTNHFYNYIPSQDQTNLPSINNEVILKEKFALLKALEGTHGK